LAQIALARIDLRRWFRSSWYHLVWR